MQGRAGRGWSGRAGSVAGRKQRHVEFPNLQYRKFIGLPRVLSANYKPSFSGVKNVVVCMFPSRFLP